MTMTCLHMHVFVCMYACMYVPLNKTGSYISDKILRCAGDFVAVTGYVRMEGGSGDEFVGLLEEKSQGKVKHGDVILMVIHPTVNNSNEESHSPPKKARLVPNYATSGKGDFDLQW